MNLHWHVCHPQSSVYRRPSCCRTFCGFGQMCMACVIKTPCGVSALKASGSHWSSYHLHNRVCLCLSCGRFCWPVFPDSSFVSKVLMSPLKLIFVNVFSFYHVHLILSYSRQLSSDLAHRLFLTYPSYFKFSVVPASHVSSLVLKIARFSDFCPFVFVIFLESQIYCT